MGALIHLELVAMDELVVRSVLSRPSVQPAFFWGGPPCSGRLAAAALLPQTITLYLIGLGHCAD